MGPKAGSGGVGGKEEGGLVMVGHCISKFSYESATPVKPGKRLAPMGETTLCKRMGVEVPHCSNEVNGIFHTEHYFASLLLIGTLCLVPGWFCAARIFGLGILRL